MGEEPKVFIYPFPLGKMTALSLFSEKHLSLIFQTLHLCDIKVTCGIRVTKENACKIEVRL